jgi:hypothetical protein
MAIMSVKRTILILLVLLVLSGGVRAMSSADHALDWFIPLTNGGGGSAASASYAARVTIGQVAVGPASSASYAGGLGYWYGVATDTLARDRAFLPFVLRE